MDEQLASVYGLKDRRNDEIFYVGMSIDPFARYGQHIMMRSAKDAKEARIISMRKEGIMPELIIFEKDIPIKYAWERETYWIQYHVDLGVQLTNIKMNTRKKTENKGIPPSNNLVCASSSIYAASMTQVTPAMTKNNDRLSPEWVYAHEAFRILWPFKDSDMPDCVRYFARKRIIRRYYNKRGTPVFHKQDILLYRDMLRTKGELPSKSKKQKKDV